MNKIFNYIDSTSIKFLLIMLSVMAYDYVYNIGTLYTLIAAIIICIVFHNLSIKQILVVSTISLCLSFLTYHQNGRMAHRWLSTYEHGTSICHVLSKDIDSRCFERGEKGVPHSAGDFIKHEYIGKSFVKDK